MLHADGQGHLRSALLLAVPVLALSVIGGGCAGSSESAGDGTPIATTVDGSGPRGTTPNDAGPADGAPTTTPAIDGPPSTAPEASVSGAGGEPGACTAATLAVQIEEESAEAGHQHRRVVLTNSGSAPCTVTGYPGVALRDGRGRPLGGPASREALAVATITLAAGASASAALDLQSPGVFPAEACGVPAPVASAQVIAPDDTEPISAPMQGEACPNPVDQLSVRPLQAGRDSQP
jgi:hypothetical protein